MARHPYSAEERNQILAKFITAAYQIMEERGPNAVTIRQVAQLAGCKSSTIYNHFSDLEHLIMYASMKYLSEYNRRLAIYISELKEPYLRFCSIWEFFSDAALQHPEAFHRLFFGKHRDDLEEVIRVYYQIFPDELGGVDPEALGMLQLGPILKRNMRILEPLIDIGFLTPEQAPAVNEIIVYCFRVLLEEKLACGGTLDNAALIQRHQEYISILLDKRYQD